MRTNEEKINRVIEKIKQAKAEGDLEYARLLSDTLSKLTAAS